MKEGFFLFVPPPPFPVGHRLLSGLLPEAIILVIQRIRFLYCDKLSASRPTPNLEGQFTVFIRKPRGRVAHFSRLLRHAWVTLGLFLFPATTRVCKDGYTCKHLFDYVLICSSKQAEQKEEIGRKFMSDSRKNFITTNQNNFLCCNHNLVAGHPT